jgi:hypothetical protein
LFLKARFNSTNRNQYLPKHKEILFILLKYTFRPISGHPRVFYWPLKHTEFEISLTDENFQISYWVLLHNSEISNFVLLFKSKGILDFHVKGRGAMYKGIFYSTPNLHLYNAIVTVLQEVT